MYWDLLRGRPTPLETFLGDLPVGCLLLIIAGSPRPQRTRAEAHRGMQGLCGADSVHYFAVPIIRWAAQRVRPDLVTHVVF